jgi:hypothetical protein
MSKNKSFTLKNHVTPKAKRIGGILKGKYGLGLDTLNQALQGNQNALKQIGEAGRQGQLTQELMPLLEDAYINLIKGTEVYNKGVSNILKTGASSAISIDKSVMQAMLANQKYGNQRRELAAEFVSGKTAESIRHQYALNYIQLKAYIDQYMQNVDGKSKLLEQANRPELKQIDEDSRYSFAVAKHLLANGDMAQVELLPRREYSTVTDTNSEGKKSVVSFKEKLNQGFGKVISALGF